VQGFFVTDCTRSATLEKADSPMDQKIEAPTPSDTDRIARQLIHASSMATDMGRSLDGSREDLAVIQALLDSGTIEAEATYSLQALGMAFGVVFLEQHPDYDWWMVGDEYGREPAIRFKQTPLLAFPQTMILKRFEDGETIDVIDLFDGLSRRLIELSEEQSKPT
jgi:hypothetical protein